MSAVRFGTGEKTENAVYLAFGVVLGLFVIRLFVPEILHDPLIAFPIAAFWGSLFGSLLYVAKADRFVNLIPERETLSNPIYLQSRMLSFDRHKIKVCITRWDLEGIHSCPLLLSAHIP